MDCADSCDRPTAAEGWFVAALTLLALALRGLALGRYELFVDEAATWWYGGLAASGQLAEQVRLEPTPPLYYLLNGLWTRLVGEGDALLRWPSVIFGTATIPAVHRLGRALWTPRAGVLAAAFLAVHPLHVFYSREARVYPLLLLWVVLLLLALWRALGAASPKRWGLVAGLLVAACYSHFYGLFVAVAVAALGLLDAPGRRLRGALAAALAVASFLPYLAVTLPHLRASGAAWSIERLYEIQPEERSLGRVLEAELVGARYHPFLRQLDRPPTPGAVRWPALLAGIGLLGVALAAGLRRQAEPIVFLVGAWLVPLLIPWAITHTARPIFHPGRHDVYVLGAVCILLAIGLDALIDARRRRRVARYAAVTLAAILLIAAHHRLAALLGGPTTAFHRPTGEWLASHAGPGDQVLALGVRRLISERYTRLAGGDVPFASYPASTDAHPGWADPRALLADEAALAEAARASVPRLDEAADRAYAGRLFVLAQSYPGAPQAVSSAWLIDRHLFGALERAGWRRQASCTAPTLRIVCYQPVDLAPRAAP